MKKISLLSVLLLSSSFVSAGSQWVTVGSEYKGDCREMMCDCVEDSDGKGYCCPTGTSFKNTGGSHPDYSPCKCPSGKYFQKSTGSCQPQPSCSSCQKFDSNAEKCVIDTTKNNQQVQDACHMCNNGQVVLKDASKTTVCGQQCCGTGQYCNQSSKTCQVIPTCPACQKFDTLTAKCVADTTKNNQQVQDACHKCSNGQVVLKDQNKRYISNGVCVECLANYGSGANGSCTTIQKPLCQNNICNPCPSDRPIWNYQTQECFNCPKEITLDGHKNARCKDSRNKLIRWENPYSCSYSAKIKGSCSGRWGALSPTTYNYGGKLGVLCGPSKNLTRFDYCRNLDGYEFTVEANGYICFDVYINSGACNGNLDIELTRID